MTSRKYKEFQTKKIRDIKFHEMFLNILFPWKLYFYPQKIYYLKYFVKFLKNNFIWRLFRWLYKLTTVLFSEQTFFVIWLRRNVICVEIISTALPTHLQLFVYLGSSCFSFRGWGGQPPIYLMSFFFNFF